MGFLYSGRDVRITDDKRVFVCVRKGIFNKTEEWREVVTAHVWINTYNRDYFGTPYGRRFSVRDLGISLADLSHLLGLSRADSEAAKMIRGDPSSIRGSDWCISPGRREMAHSDTPCVYPFSAFSKIIRHPAPTLAVRHCREFFKVGTIAISLDQLAALLEVPLVETED